MRDKKTTAIQHTLNWIKKYREFNGGDYPNGDEIEAQLTMNLETEKEQIVNAHAEGQIFIVGLIEEAIGDKIDLTITKQEIEKRRSGKDNDETAEKYYDKHYGK